MTAAASLPTAPGADTSRETCSIHTRQACGCTPDNLALRRLLRKYGHASHLQALAALERAGVDPAAVRKATP